MRLSARCATDTVLHLQLVHCDCDNVAALHLDLRREFFGVGSGIEEHRHHHWRPVPQQFQIEFVHPKLNRSCVFIRLSVVIHITQPVLKELNKIKDTGNTKSIRRRAATVQKRLKQFLKAPGTAEVSNGVTLRFHSRSAIALQHSGLDDAVADDALISALLTFAQDSGEPAYLMTDDSGLGLMVKADEWKITVIEPSDDLRLPPEADPDQKERDELRKRLAQLEQSRPDLDLSFVSGGQLLKAAPLVSDVPACRSLPFEAT